jgi:hypothetical protein
VDNSTAGANLCLQRSKARVAQKEVNVAVKIPDNYPLCVFFLSRYLQRQPHDALNFPLDQFPDGFIRYETLFHDALFHLTITKEGLKAKGEFNFDSGDPNNLESALGVLRAAIHLGQAKFSKIALIKSKKGMRGADLTAEKNGFKVCFEVKTITKRSTGKKNLFLADKLFEKIKEGITSARDQLASSEKELQCDLTIYVCVVNWFEQTIYLNQSDFQQIVDKLEKNEEEESLQGVDGVWFILKSGHLQAFLNDEARVLDT